MAKSNPSCGHAVFDKECPICIELQKQYYDLLKDSGFKDIEYGLENSERIYQPVNLEEVNPETTGYYDAVWSVYHSWKAEGRSERDLLLAELLASQQGSTGTIRGIVKVLKSKGLKPSQDQSVQKTIREINSLIIENIKITTSTSK